MSNKGYHVIARYTRGNNIKTDLQTLTRCLSNRLEITRKKSGTEVATEILDVYPSGPILFITADYRQPEVIEKNPKFRDKNVDVLLKPVKLGLIEHRIINLMNK